MKQTFDFQVEHMYRVAIDESRIDASMADWEPTSQEWKAVKEQRLQRFHRMFRALTSNQKAFSKVLVYRALYEHFIESEETFRFHEQEFGDGITFGRFLLSLANYLHPDDKAWLLQCVKKEQEQSADDEESHYDLDEELMPLCLALGGIEYYSNDNYKGTEVLGWDMTQIQFKRCEHCEQKAHESKP